MPHRDLLTFFVGRFVQFATRSEVWLVYRGERHADCCVGTFDACADAIRRAVEMAEYHVASGGDAQVQLQAPSGTEWRTIWVKRGSAPAPAVPEAPVT